MKDRDGKTLHCGDLVRGTTGNLYEVAYQPTHTEVAVQRVTRNGRVAYGPKIYMKPAYLRLEED